MSKIVGTETTAKEEIHSRARVISYWATTALLAFVVGSGGIGKTTEEGYKLSVRRMIEPESVFGQMKSNRNFRRFLLRSLHNVSLEVGWLSLAHNLLKWATINQKARVVGTE